MPEFVPQHTPRRLDAFTTAYLECAEWLLDEDIDRDTVKGFADEAIEKAKADCAAFQKANMETLNTFYAQTGLEDANGGHDFYLTRNHHGAGFWDRQHAGEVGEQLTKASHAFREIDLYQGDDGFLYFQ